MTPEEAFRKSYNIGYSKPLEKITYSDPKYCYELALLYPLYIDKEKCQEAICKDSAWAAILLIAAPWANFDYCIKYIIKNHIVAQTFIRYLLNKEKENDLPSNCFNFRDLQNDDEWHTVFDEVLVNEILL